MCPPPAPPRCRVWPMPVGWDCGRAGETPFEKRTDFVSAMEAGGVAAMEVVCARFEGARPSTRPGALAYDGIQVDILEHPLTPEQRRIYDAYAGAFKVIHANIEEALKATGIVQGEDTLNKNAKAAALSAFEGTKQRFFGHLLTGMKCPSTIRSIEADLAAERSAVVQLVSTGEALMERRIADVPASEWDDLNIDLTPRDAILSYLMHAFPVQLQEPFTDDGGNLLSRPATDEDGNPVICREAEDRRDALIEKLAALPPVPTRARPDRAAFRARGRGGGHRALAACVADHRCEGPTPLAAQPARLRQPRRDRRVHGRREAHPGLLDGRRHRTQLPRGPVLREHRAAHSLPAGARMARRPGDSGAGPHPPHPPGFGAAVPARDHEREGRAALHRHHRQKARFPGRHHEGPAGFPDRDGRQRRGRCSARATIWKSLYARAALRQFYGALWRGRHRGLDPGALREGHRAEAHLGGIAQGRPAAHAQVPEPAIGVAHRPSRTSSSPSWKCASRPISSRRSRPAATRSASRQSPPTRSLSPAGRRSTSIPAPKRPPSWSRSSAATGWCRFRPRPRWRSVSGTSDRTGSPGGP